MFIIGDVSAARGLRQSERQSSVNNRGAGTCSKAEIVCEFFERLVLNSAASRRPWVVHGHLGSIDCTVPVHAP